ncbi:MAG: hypothetical protein Q7U76_07400 [Nitrospirota bacterium]|nr:hypothetical protein [Nitrospirota bacterium]
MSEALSRQGAYIVFCSHKFGGQKIERLRKAIASAIRRGKKNPSRATAIEIYDANRIADWVNTHPPVALWLASLKRQRSLAGFLSHEAWGREDEIRNIPWIADESPRFSPSNIINPDAEFHGGNRTVWTFEQAAEAALSFLARDHAALRIAGPSGFGKSRFAFEVFNRQATVSDEVERTAVIYADLGIVGDEVAKLALEIADAGSSAILVVDDCPDELHTKLAAIARRTGSRLRLVTIDVETKVQDTLVIRLEPASDGTIGSIAHAVASTLSDSDSRFIQELAKGFPKMAVLAARQDGIGGKAIRSAEQVLERVVWGRRQRVEEAQRALEILSLFEWVGLTGRVDGEGKLIAEKLGGMTQDALVEHSKSFFSRGVVVQRGDFVQVAPIPLAASLGSTRLSLLPERRLLAFFLEAPDSLKTSLLRRMKWLDTSAEAKAFARSLLAADCLGNLAILNTESGAECLDHLVHVDPDLVMVTIQRVFGGLADDELQQVRAGRRHLVWALEKLAFRKESFDGAAMLLRRLAASETEGNISNNATGQFKQLYQLYLSGTEAPPEVRLLVLDDGLRSSSPKEREVCIDALDRMLETGHFYRGGGTEGIGSGERLKDWAPRTYSEISDFLRAAIKRLTDIAVGSDPLAPRAKQILGSRIRGLIGKIPLEEVKAFISRIVSRYGFWPEAVQKVNEWLYFNRKEAPKDLGDTVRVYFDELLPRDPVDLAVLYTHAWQGDFCNPDVDYEREQATSIDFEYATRKATELAEIIANNPSMSDRALERFVVSDGKTVFPFARRLAECAPSITKLFEAALAKTEQRQEAPNLDLFRGLIAGADSRDTKAARDCIRLALNSVKLKQDAVSMIGAGKLQSDDIQLVVSLLQSGDVTPWQCASLSYEQRMEHLDTKDILPLLRELSQHGAEGLWAVLNIVSMVLRGGKELTKPLVSNLQNVLVDPRLFDGMGRNGMRGHDLERIVSLLAQRNLIDRQFARALVRQLLGICAPRMTGVFHDLDGPVRSSLKALIKRHPREVWAGISRLLLENDFLIRHRVEGLVGIEHDDCLGPGFLYTIPADFYLKWTRKDPARRASLVMKWLPVATKNADGSLVWHSAIESFISEFGDQERVLAALSSRLRPQSYYGSPAPYLDPLVNLLKSWATHPRPTVRQWARDRINWIKAQVQ